MAVTDALGVGAYGTKEAAVKLGLSRGRLRVLARQGGIAAGKLGHDWLILKRGVPAQAQAKETEGGRMMAEGCRETSRLLSRPGSVAR